MAHRFRPLHSCPRLNRYHLLISAWVAAAAPSQQLRTAVAMVGWPHRLRASSPVQPRRPSPSLLLRLRLPIQQELRWHRLLRIFLPWRKAKQWHRLQTVVGWPQVAYRSAGSAEGSEGESGGEQYAKEDRHRRLERRGGNKERCGYEDARGGGFDGPGST